MLTERAFGRACQAAVLALAAAVGFWGLRWGLPDKAVLDAVSPPGLEQPAFLTKLATSWAEMHARLGPNLSLNPDGWKSFSGVSVVEPGWKEPPEALLNSYRSFRLRTVHDDETTFLLALSRMRPEKLDFRHHVFSYGAVYIYSLGAWLAAGWCVGAVTLHRNLATYLADPALIGALYWWGRALSALAAAGCGLMLLRIGRRHLRPEASLWAAVLFVACPAVVVQAHVMKNHTVWALFAIWTLDLCLGLLDRAEPKGYALAGAASGLAVGSFLPAWPACAAIAITAALRASQDGGWARELKGLALAAAACLAVFAVTNPPLIFDFREAVAEIRVLGGLAGQRSALIPFVFLWESLRRALTTPAWLWLIAGVGWGLSRGRRDPKIFLLALVCLAAWLSTGITGANFTFTVAIRYWLGWLAPGLLLAGELLVSARARWPRAALAAGALAAAHVALSGFAYAYNFQRDKGTTSTNYEAGRWIEENIPPGSAIGMIEPPSPSRGPYFRYDRYRLVLAEASLLATMPAERLPRYLAVSNSNHPQPLEPNLSRYRLRARFERPRLLPWLRIDPTSTTANAVIEVYELATSAAPRG